MRRARLALQRLTSLTITPSRHPQKKDAQIAYITAPDTAVLVDFQQCGILTSTDSDELMQPHV